MYRMLCFRGVVGSCSWGVRAASNETRSRLRYLKRKHPILPPEEESLIYQFASDQDAKRKVRVYMWGNSQYGALGQPGFLMPNQPSKSIVTQMPKPYRMTFGEFHDVRALACGYGFTVFATNEKEAKLWGTGVNSSGQIGHHRGPEKKRLEVVIQPAPIPLPLQKGDTVKSLSCGRAHTLILSNQCRLFTLGHNAFGQCGRPIIENEDYSRNRLINEIKLDEEPEEVIAGQDHSILRTSSGELFSCGWGADGQTGLGHYNNCDTFTRIEGDIKGEKISKVACSADCVLAINDKGDIFGWGNSEYGQFHAVTEEQQISSPVALPLGLGKIIDVASGGTVCLVVNEEGDVFVWGYGILGKGPKLDMTTKPQLIPATLFGRNQFSPDTRVAKVFAGVGHMAAINSSGDLFIWGKNRNGCLGLGSNSDNQFFPLKITLAGRVETVGLGVDHSAAIVRPW